MRRTFLPRSCFTVSRPTRQFSNRHCCAGIDAALPVPQSAIESGRNTKGCKVAN